jgi:hypothetical protein
MTLTPEQKATVSSWIAAGDNLSAVQKKLREQFQVSMTYMDVRFLVDDLNLTLKDPNAEGGCERRHEGQDSARRSRQASPCPGKEGPPRQGEGEARPRWQTRGGHG